MKGDKPYELTLVNRDRYVYAHVKADTITRPAGLQYLTEIVEACRNYGKDTLIIYRDIPRMLSPADVKGLASDFTKMIADIKTAAVNPYLTPDEVTVSANLMRNTANYAIFSNFRAAEAWLLS